MAHIPKPFKRPGIELSSGRKKEWREVEAQHIEVGDVVRDRGAVEKAETYAQELTKQPGEFIFRTRHVYTNKSEYTYDATQPLRAFTEVTDG
jgi:hypothetical protein